MWITIVELSEGQQDRGTGAHADDSYSESFLCTGMSWHRALQVLVGKHHLIEGRGEEREEAFAAKVVAGATGFWLEEAQWIGGGDARARFDTERRIK